MNVPTTALIALVSVVLGALYGCTSGQRQYYDAFNRCVAAGGSAIPIGGGWNNDLVCVHGDVKR